uniref:Uncharacterized protein n=1 Tax=Knipowitschia caucasica TaxID=637954 RepID=A0AAV2LRW2_KNICA
MGYCRVFQPVGRALSVLRSSEEVAPAPQNKFIGDIEELAASYERKLIEVAEMHGELIEFNERLYCSLMAKDRLIVHMRQELIDLRGPIPGDLSQTSDDPSLSDFETAHRALINVWIPSVFLQGRAANAYHVYQISCQYGRDTLRGHVLSAVIHGSQSNNATLNYA